MLTLFTVPLAGMWHSQRSTPGRAVPTAISAAEPLSDDGPSLDIFGNEVSSAVATYKLDAAGSMYEEHSPQTELPRLGSPIS